ncbi:MAG: serine hydrolase [Paucibacter sp.]|nr:serine hydrolase [Roseateles sp.]
MNAGLWPSGVPDTLALSLGWALLNFVWEGVVIGLAAGLAMALLRHASPQRRYAVLALALACCLALPLAHLGWQLLAATSPVGGLTADAVDDGAVLAPSWLLALQARLPALVTAWSLGVGLMALRLVLGLHWVASLRRRAVEAPPAWQAHVQALARRLHLNRPVLLRVLPDITSPLTVGSWRPMVLLPAALLSGMPLPLLEALLAHELAHVQRWDYLANLLQSAVEAVLFFHPVVWWLSTRLREEREAVADALAVRALGEPHRLAQALHELSSRMPASPIPTLTLSARGGHLFKRIERLLTPQPHVSSWKFALPALLLASASLVVQAGGASRNLVESPARAADPQAAASAPEAIAPPSASTLMRLPVNARHVLVLDEASGRVLFQKDAEAVVPIASLSKLMTAMVLLDARQDPEEKLRISSDDVDTLKHSRSLVRVGAEMSRQSALELALIASENRAAAALARNYPGGIGAFTQALQAKIRSLGLAHTSLIEPTGLSPSNTSTAQDVARIVAAAARYPEISRITSERSTRVEINGRPRELHNTNHLVGSKGWDIQLSKTGYTDEAGRCLTMRMRSGQRDVTVVLLDADGSAQRLHDAARIRQSLAKL